MATDPTPVTDLLIQAQQAAGDWLYIVDASETAESDAGSSRRTNANRWAWTNGVPATIVGGGTINLNGFTLTAPATGALVTTTGDQTLSNKNFSDSVAIGTDNSSIKLHIYQDINEDAEARVQNPNVGALARAMLRLVTDGALNENAVLMKHGRGHASYPNGLVLLNLEGNIGIITDACTVTLEDNGTFRIQNPGGEIRFDTLGDVLLPNALDVDGQISGLSLVVTGPITLDGSIFLDNAMAIFAKDTTAVDKQVLILNATNDLLLGGGVTPTNFVAISPGGSDRLIVQGDGKVGIGIAPAGAFEVKDSRAGHMRSSVSLVTDTEVIVVPASGGASHGASIRCHIMKIGDFRPKVVEGSCEKGAAVALYTANGDPAGFGLVVATAGSIGLRRDTGDTNSYTVAFDLMWI